MLNYGRIADYLCLEQCGQREAAEELMHELCDNGQIDAESLKLLNSSEVRKIMQGLRIDAVNQVRTAISALEYIDTLMLINGAKPTLLSASIDDVIEAVLESGLLRRPSDWAAVVMLATDLGKPVTATSLCNALSNNAKAINFGLPSRQLLHAAFVEHTRKNAYPNWNRKTQKEERFYKIAEHVYSLVSVL